MDEPAIWLKIIFFFLGFSFLIMDMGFCIGIFAPDYSITNVISIMLLMFSIFLLFFCANTAYGIIRIAWLKGKVNFNEAD